MGLLTEPPATFLQSLREQELTSLAISPEKIEELIEERRAAREKRDWQRADQIRDLLLEAGIELQDGVAGTTWQVKKD
jgi:cysteinyl-tRNA synthetase